MEDNKILPIDLLVVNLYPFEDIVSKQNCEMLEAIENIDIGGSAMLRAAAKNYVKQLLVIKATTNAY
jgi:phosphoribosylaminoimidazolecarboxamide formyltransferase / IMP cyclohydrolase